MPVLCILDQERVVILKFYYFLILGKIVSESSSCVRPKGVEHPERM